MKKELYLVALIFLLLPLSLLFSACREVEFKIKFIIDGQEYAVVTTAGNETITMPENPTKTDYEFDGWYLDNNTWQQPFTANSLLNQPLKKDMSVYAKWKIDETQKNTEATFRNFTKISDDTYYISLSNTTEMLNISNEIEINNKNTWKLTTDIQANNAIVSKIATLNIGNNTYYVLVTAESGDVKLYTLNIRRKPMYNVTFNTLDGTTIDNQEIEEDALVNIPESPTKHGYNFVSWDYNFELAITHNTIITASYEPKTCIISYFANNDSNEQLTENVKYDSCVVLKSSNAFSKTAYDLIGWNTKIDGTGTDYDLEYQFEKYNYIDELNLYAKWEPISFIITYNLDGGINGDNPLNYNIECSDIVLKNATKDGYNFDGWYTDKNFENKLDIIKSDSIENIVLYAKFSIIEYIITYHFNGGTNANNINTFNVESETIYLSDAYRTAYGFGGWYTEDTYEHKIDSIPKGSFGNLELYAKWEQIYVVTNDGIISNITNYGKKLEILDIPNVIDGITTNTIGSSAFDGCIYLNSITIPSSIINISTTAFSSNLKNIIVNADNEVYSSNDGVLFNKTETNLIKCPEAKTSYIIPSSVKTIETEAFKNCKKLVNLAFENESLLSDIGSSAFYGCSSLLNITIPISVKSIGYRAFYCCKAFTEITIPKNVTNIGSYAFSGCYNVTTIRFNAIECKDFTYQDVIYFFMSTGNKKTGLTLIIGKDVTKIPSYFAYSAGYGNITSVIFEDNSVCSTIGERAFDECYFSSITIPNSVNSIGDYAFALCHNLSSVVLGESIIRLGKEVFGATALADIYYMGSQEQFNNIDIHEENDVLFNASIYYYSNEDPGGSGNYWHYDDNKQIIIWKTK